MERTWLAPGPLELLLAATSPERLRELHPLITAVAGIRREGEVEHWTIDERVPLGPLSIPNHYRASRRVEPGRIVMEAWSRPAVHLVHTLDLEEVAEGVRVVHRVEVEAPALLRGFVEDTARKAHDEWIARVQAWIAAQR